MTSSLRISTIRIYQGFFNKFSIKHLIVAIYSFKLECNLVWCTMYILCTIWFLINFRYTISYLLSSFRPESCQILVVDDVTNNCSKLVIKIHCLFYTMEKLHCYLLLNKKRRHWDLFRLSKSLVLFTLIKSLCFFPFIKWLYPIF